ncbi:hypothetical protein CUR178_04951 [Leishmania enriettii]|uniref:Trafficking protein particle complex subunit 10 n=1 Tax=Leishmania enriettii TaxID=5663 RepID=A0A836KL13_LEIEN|nr:hypothetical protein CUR178_04951 [Leishmania enriettii]
MFPGYVPVGHHSPLLPKAVLSPLSSSNPKVPKPNGDEVFSSPLYAAIHSTAPTAPMTGAESNSSPAASPSTCICPGNRVDTNFDLPPALVTCLVRHTDGQHQPLATPAIVERCLRDLQHRFMPWVPAERVFGPTAEATVPIGTEAYGASHQRGNAVSSPVNRTAPQAGSYLAGSRVRLQLAKTTDIASVASGTPVLHLLFYAVDELESRPAVLAHIAQEWRAALMRKGEGADCLILLVHSDLIAAAEAVSRFAEEAQQSSDQTPAATSESPVPTGSAPSLTTCDPASAAPAVSQARVDAAAGYLGKYCKELRDAKFLPQQMCAYIPNETPMRILERLRSSIITQGARLRQTLEACAARKRLAPQDPLTKPGASVAATASTTAVMRPPALAPSPNTTASSAGTVGEAPPSDGAASPSMSPQKPPVDTEAAPPPTLQKYWSVQDFWRCGYDLVVHYLQYGLVFDARAVLERLFLEYYNSSDDYDFVRAPVATLQRLGRVPNLFEAHRHASWASCKSGYPRGLETGAELLEGLLLVVSAEMTCSLLLGDTAAAMARYHTFMQVTREKFEEWSAVDVTGEPSVPPSPTPAKDNAGGAPPLHPATYHQFFLLQCYLSGLRVWWPMSGLCRPRCEAAASLAASSPQQPQREKFSGLAAEKLKGAYVAPSIFVPLTALPSMHPESSEAGLVIVDEGLDNDDGARSVSAAPQSSVSVPAKTTESANALDLASLVSSDNGILDPLERHDGGVRGVRYSMTNASLVAASGSVCGQPSRIGIDGLFSGGSGGEHSAMRRRAGEGFAGESAAGPVASPSASLGAGAALESDADKDGDAMIYGGELDYLLKDCVDTVHVAVTYLVGLATSTGLLAAHMEPEELQGNLQVVREAVDAGDAQVMPAMQHNQRHLRRSCAEAATLLEHARDALAAVARDLGYGHFSYAVGHTASASLDAQSTRGSSPDDAAAATAEASSSPFANVEELSSPEQALRLWRVLTAMAALALRIGGQRRREFHLYAELAVTFLADYPNVTASIVAERLLPHIKRQGWRRIEMFMRRLYVEARERLMHQAGFRPPGSTLTAERSGGAAEAAAISEPLARLCPRVFRTDADYALYRECVLVLLSNSGDCGADDVLPRSGDSADSPAGAAVCGVASEDVVGSFDSCFFSACTRTERWRALVRVDALLMGTALLREPCEYPLEHFTSPLTVKVERKATATSAAVLNGDHACVMNASYITGGLDVLEVEVDDVVQITFAFFCTINLLMHSALPSAAEDTSAVAREAKPEVRFQLTLESRKDWSTDEEAAHEVSISGADAADYDEQTRRLRVSFTFAVCHAGLYRVRHLRLCNGSTWLAHYPQCSTTGSCADRSGWASSLRDAASQALATPRPMAAVVEPLYRRVGHSALLQVPERSSSVHLRLTLPHEAHCFADSVDYMTLDVALEDPLSISAPELTAASADDSGGALSAALSDSKLVNGLAAAAGKQSREAEGGGPHPTAHRTCSFKVDPGKLLLPLSASRSSGGNGQSAHHQRTEPHASLVSGSAEAHCDASTLRRVSVASPALNCLLPARADGRTNSAGNKAHMASGAPHLVAAVVLGTPSAHRRRSGSVARSNLGASFSSLSMAVSGAGPPGVLITRGDSGTSGRSGSWAARTSQPVDVLSLSRRRVSARSAAAAHALSASPVDVREAADPGAIGRTQRDNSDKPLRIGSFFGAAAAAAVTATHVDTGAAQTTAMIVPSEPHSAQSSPQQTPSFHALRHTKVLLTPERGAQDGWFTAGDVGTSEDERGHRGAAVFVSGLGFQGISSGVPLSPALSPLRKVSDDTLELVLVHSDTVIREEKTAAAAPHNAKATAAAAMAAARTVVPIRLSSFLNRLPSPEVHLKTATKSGTAVTDTSVLLAESCASADPLRETVIQLLQGASHVVEPTTNAAESEKAGVTVTHMRLRLPLLPLLTTPISAETLAKKRPETVTSSRGVEMGPAPSAAVAASQARIAFTCLRGREPCTATLSAVFPFQAAIGFDYAFKHFQGRVYCLVKMKNLLSSTSLWLRGAVLRVLDAEPSYEVVRVSEVYNKLLLKEWKPQEELSILYELALIASFHPMQPECAHQVQIEAVYSSWHQTFLATPPENRLVLHTTELPPTEVAADDVEVIREEILLDATGVNASDGVVTQQSTATASNTGLAGKPLHETASADVPASIPGTATTSHHHSDAGPATAAHAVRRASRARSTSTDRSRSRSFVRATHLHCSASSSEVKSQAAVPSAVHFNMVTLRHLEATCNTMWGPVAAFRSKHLCVFSIVMYAESPWTMRFGAATNYVPQPLPTSPTLSSTAGGCSPLLCNTLRSAATAAPRAHPPHPSSASNSFSFFRGPQLMHWCGSGGTDDRPGSEASFFGNAMVDQPSDFVFVAGEPVRFCVRLQPQAQNWPEDAGMTETFFIRLKYDPEQWMVIGKQRDRRSLSLMEEVTVYFNAVPLLPPTSAEGDTSTARPSGEAASASGRCGETPPRRADAAADNGRSEDTDGDEDGCASKWTGHRQRHSSRPLAGHAVKDEGILQTPTVEMFWERKKPATAVGSAASPPTNSFGGGKGTTSATEAEGSLCEADGQPACAAAVMGEAVLIDVVQFRTWVRVRKRGH